MSKYGAKYLQWAPFASSNPEPESSIPNYGTPINLGKLVSVSDSPTYNEAKAYGDDALAEYINEFKEVGIDVEVSELSAANASAIFGATLGSGSSDTDLKFSGNDNAPYGGLGFYIRKMVDNVVKYQGVYYPKVKASMQGESYATKGDSITLTGSKIKMTGAAAKNGQWKVVSADLESESAAKTWVDGKIVAASSGG